MTKIIENLPCKFPNKKTGGKNTDISQMLATPGKSSKKKKALLASDKGAQKEVKYSDIKLYNKIEDNFHMNNKKALFMNLKNYFEAMDEDVFDHVPLTFHIKTGLEDPEFKRFEQHY